MICFFDVDNTLYHNSTVRSFLRPAFREGVLPLKILPTLPYYFLRFFITGIRPQLQGKKLFGLQGISESGMKMLTRRVYKDKIRPGLDTRILQEVDICRKAGDKIVLATSSFYPLVEPLAAEIAADDLIATDIDFRNGISTGIMKSIPPYREGKKIRVMEYLRSSGTSLKDCTFFTDHHDDLPLLKAVGHPVAVNPTPKLRRIARRKKWRILDTGAVRKHKKKRGKHD
jgi:HAD superfamily hydrolase (TIGR01490 family)